MPDRMPDRPDPRRLSLAVPAIVLAILILAAPGVLLVIFGGILLAVFLRAGGQAIARRTGLGPRAGVGLFMASLLAALVLFALFAAPSVGDQFDRLATRLPEALDSLRQRLEASEWSRAVSRMLRPDPAAGMPASAIGATLGGLGNAVVLLFIGIYGAIDPDPYRRGFRALFAPALRGKVDALIDAAAAQLRGWLVARLFSMAVAGGLTTLGLWAAGVPLALVLGLIAGLSGFIPNLGPVLSALPALALALAGDAPVWVVAGLYLAVQTVESYLLTPLVEAREVSLPPALVLAAQLLMGVLFGIGGVALASPLAAVGLVVIRRAYVRDVLEARA
jgi:predicted PurR-regulated permease PerM